MKTSLKFATLLLLAALPALAQQSRVFREGNSWVAETTGSLPKSRVLRVVTDMGAVRVQGREQPAITYTIRKLVHVSSEQSARRLLEAFHVSASQHGDQATIEGSWEGGNTRKFSADFSIVVPPQLDSAKLETQGGELAVKNISGRVEASTGGGSIDLDKVAGNISGETGGGSINVGEVGANLNLETGGGSIQVRSAKGTIQLQTGGGSVIVRDCTQGAIIETGGGNIQVDHCKGRVKASTGGGGIELGDISGPADLDTGGGSIHLAAASGRVHAETGGGSIEMFKLAQGVHAETGGGSITAQFIASPGGFGDSVLETPSGDINVYLASDLALSVQASIDGSGGHHIRSDFPEIKISSESDDYGPRRASAEGKLNGGGPVLKVHASSGDISFLRSR